MIHWPAIIKYSNDDELTFVGSIEEWNKNPELHRFGYALEDVLVDSTGQVFALTDVNNDIVTPRKSGNGLNLDEIINLVRKHASVCGQCCISKINAGNIGNAIQLVEGISL